MTLCSDWITGADVAECCTVEGASDSTVFDGAAQAAQELLFELSLRRFVGTCEITVRPCSTMCGCPWQILSRGHIVWNPNWLSPWGYGWWSCGGSDTCGCRPLSRVLLAGYVTEIVEVLIDGAVIDPNTYRVDRNRWLVRTREHADDQVLLWPGCQNLDLPETEEGTWAVTYRYGVEVPIAGVNAAIELACEIYKSCQGQECALPKGTTRIVRQGVVVEKPAFTSWGFSRGNGTKPRGWNTGLPMTDAFLNAYNPSGLTRVPVFWSPATELRYAEPVGLHHPGS